MLAILAPILVFGLVIFIHEFGHFMAAKATGVYAPRFSIGFGPAIFKFRKGETEYVLAWLPLGGYVRMASRHDAETAFLEGGSEEETARHEADPNYDPDGMIPFGPKPVPENRWFESKPLWARIIVMIAGVFMNCVLAVVVGMTLAMHYGQVVWPSTVVGSVDVPASVPALARIQSGDSIRAVNGHAVSTWNDAIERIAGSDNSVQITTQRGTFDIPLRNVTAAQEAAGSLGYRVPPVIDSIVPGDRAAQAGFQRGDSIVSVDGHAIRSWADMVAIVSASANKLITFIVHRRAGMDTLNVTPRAATEPDPATGQPRTVGKMGAAAKDLSIKESVGLVASIGTGLRLTWVDATAVFRVLHEIGTGAVSVRELGGPIAITRASVSAARNGIDQLFELIALLSINVAVLNLLPIPILDGGQILINVLESAKGSPFSLRTREYILRFGLLAIALLFAIVMYNDTRSAFAKLFGWIGHLIGA